ncbi:MAG: PrsW family glutamic-type intramembrane protease [Lachnospiraceae bacterium]|nr:PrsW family intramembrane metalloprotease [Lachnospiraceae bacterium]MDO4207802.1 PrsW family glutamic-type intramembrane protease [Lachnospiraceae bacterium]
MFISILIFIASIVPSVLIIILLRRRRKEDLLYKKSCNSALIRGLISVLPILAVSAALYILNATLRRTILQDVDVLVYQALYKFIVIAFAEELVKYLVFRGLLKKKLNAYTWADVVAFMVIIGTGFGLIEDIPYAIGATPIIMLVRGFTMGHVGYGFIMGWFYGKKLYTGKKGYGIIAFLLPFLLHGIYDYSLTPELIAFNDNFAVVAVALAILDLVLLALMIRFFIRSKKKDRYNKPLIEIETDPAAANSPAEG